MAKQFEMLYGEPGDWHTDYLPRDPSQTDADYANTARLAARQRQDELRDGHISGTVRIVPIETAPTEPGTFGALAQIE